MSVRLRNDDDGESVDVQPVRMDISPISPGAKTVAIVEGEGETEHDEVPDDQRQRHGHQAEVARRRKPRVRRSEMAGKRSATTEEVRERHPYRYICQPIL